MTTPNENPAPNDDRRLATGATVPQFALSATPATQAGKTAPKLGGALKAALEAMLADGRATILGGRIMWPDDAEDLLEDEMNVRLANALSQPLQFKWVSEYFLAVLMTHIQIGDKTADKAMFQVLGTYIGMACGQMPWPSDPKAEEAERKKAAKEPVQGEGEKE